MALDYLRRSEGGGSIPPPQAKPLASRIVSRPKGGRRFAMREPEAIAQQRDASKGDVRCGSPQRSRTSGTREGRRPRKATCRLAATDCIYVDAMRFSATGTWASPTFRPRPVFFPRSGRPGAPRASSRRDDASANHRFPHAATHHGFLDGRARLADTAASHGLPDDDPAHPRALPGSAA